MKESGNEEQVDRTETQGCEIIEIIESAHDAVLTAKVERPITVKRRRFLGLASLIGVMAAQIQMKAVYAHGNDNEDDKNDRLCISRDKLRRIALSAGDIVDEQARELSNALEQGAGEPFLQMLVQRLRRQGVISERDADVLDQIVTVIFLSDSVEELRRQALAILKKLQNRPNANPVVLAFADIIVQVTSTPSVTPSVNAGSGPSPRPLAGPSPLPLVSTTSDAAIIGGGALIGAGAGFAVAGPPGAVAGAIGGAIVGFIISLFD